MQDQGSLSGIIWRFEEMKRRRKDERDLDGGGAKEVNGLAIKYIIHE